VRCDPDTITKLPAADSHNVAGYHTDIMWIFYSCIEANSIVIKPLFIPLPTALFHGLIGAFRAQKNKSNDLYLPVMA
jgi:hypothetical protein